MTTDFISLCFSSAGAMILWLGLPYGLGYFLHQRGFRWSWAVAGALVGAMTGPLLISSYPCCCCLTYIHFFPAALLVPLSATTDDISIGLIVSCFWTCAYAGLGFFVDWFLHSQAAHSLEDPDQSVGG